MNSGAYRAAIGLALAGALLVLWVQAAVTTDDDAPGLVFFAVLAVGIVGAVIARFRPAGMERALFATAIAQMLLAVGAMIAWQQYLEIAILNGIFLVLWIGSALLFRRAARMTP